ncbi:MAG: diguanylate cyclase domain-containing protein [Lachnospiraceae bacterium]
MKKEEYEQKINELEDQIKVMKERYQILVETTPTLLFEYKPEEDKMTFTYNFPDNKSQKKIDAYHEYIKQSPLVHPDHLQKFMDVLDRASLMPVRGEIEYLSKVSNGEFQWHKTHYSSIADKNGKVISVIGKIDNIHEMATERQEMIHKVETDFLTGLYNKGAATEKISDWLKMNPTKEAHLILINVDNFKKINDIYGYSYGDEILKEAAKIIGECFHDNCLLSRFDGVAFVIFVKDEPIRQVESNIDVLIQRLSNEVNRVEQTLRYNIGVSARVSRQDTFEDMFNRADNAMYLAKKK